MVPPRNDVVIKMKLFLNFLRQQVPKSGGEVPYYYQQSIRINDQMLAIYFFLSFVLISWSTQRFFWLPIVFQCLLLLKLYYQKKLSVRISLLVYTLLVFAWCWWYVVSLGWDLGGQHILTVLILLVFFCLYEPPMMKLAYFLAIFAIPEGGMIIIIVRGIDDECTDDGGVIAAVESIRMESDTEIGWCLECIDPHRPTFHVLFVLISFVEVPKRTVGILGHQPRSCSFGPCRHTGCTVLGLFQSGTRHANRCSGILQHALDKAHIFLGIQVFNRGPKGSPLPDPLVTIPVEIQSMGGIENDLTVC